MDWSDIWKVAGPLLGFGLNHWLGERKWAKVRKVARTIAADQAQTNDPGQAVAEALVRVSLDRLAKEADKVKDAFVPKGSIPKLNVEFEKTGPQ